MSIIIGIDHGYYAIKTAHCSFPAGITGYGTQEPYTRQGLLEFGGCFFVCGTGRQPIQRDKTANDNYYLLTLAAIAKEIQQRSLPPDCKVRLAVGLPLTGFGRDKEKFKSYLLRSAQPVNFRFEGVSQTQRKEYLVQVILAAEQADRLEKIVRTALREELQDADLALQISDTPQGKDIPTNALDFLSAL